MKTLAAASVLLLTGAASAQFDLRVTEIWMGNDPGENITDDWFEITNFGDTAWTASVDGDLYFDDESADFSAADQLFGITTILPGQTVVFVDTGDLTEWNDFWSTGLPAGTQVGTYAGSGLGQGGDAVALFLDAGFDGVDAGDLFTTEAYPDAEAFGGRSWDPTLDGGAFSTLGPNNDSNAYASLGPNDAGQFGIASPGTIAPAPGAFALAGIASLTVVRRRRA
ncbi:MAG: hypothetical protein AAGH64_02030 [Planctomycetota bacterium]